VYRLIHKRDGEIARCFNDQRRSMALEQLTGMRSLGLITDDEMERFSPEVREIVSFLLTGE
jgi:hypothetical protein